MSENITINFADALNYEPYQGDGSAVLLPQDGMFQVKITKFKTGTSPAGNKTVKLVLALAETDVSGTLYSDIPVTGKRSDGKLNVEKFFDVLISAGQTLDQLKAAGQAGKSGDIGTIIQGLIDNGTVLIVDVEASTHKGRTSSKVQNFVSPKRFSDAKTAGNHRRTRGGAGAATAVSSNGATSAPAAGGADPLQQILG